jgi:hypothetical protein
MNPKTMLSIVVVVAAVTLATANSAFAEGEPKAEKNFDQCKKDFNKKPCKNFHTAS